VAGSEEQTPPEQASEVVTPQQEGAGDEAKIPTPESAPWWCHMTIAIRLLAVGILLCSVAYPVVVSLAGHALWSAQVEGSVVELDGESVGSRLIGQQFTSDLFFHPRPSFRGYDAMHSGSQNLGPHSEALTERVKEQLGQLKQQGISPENVPVSWVTESGSGLDPHISPDAARLQIPRVSRASGLSRKALEGLIERHTEGKLLGLFGQERVNVLLLNLAVRKGLAKANE